MKTVNQSFENRNGAYELDQCKLKTRKYVTRPCEIIHSRRPWWTRVQSNQLCVVSFDTYSSEFTCRQIYGYLYKYLLLLLSRTSRRISLILQFFFLNYKTVIFYTLNLKSKHQYGSLRYYGYLTFLILRFIIMLIRSNILIILKYKIESAWFAVLPAT